VRPFARGSFGSSATKLATIGVRQAGVHSTNTARPCSKSCPLRLPADDEVLDRDRRGRLFSALDQLGEGERTAVVARYLIGLTDAETAAALGVPRATVKMRAWRGLSRLRRDLGEELT
jgi:RNA polymerase sigma factor (sigma-70 family)